MTTKHQYATPPIKGESVLKWSERHARMAWSLIVEPGDAQVHRWAEAAGSYAAGLWMLTQNLAPNEIRHEPEVEDAQKRWLSRISGMEAQLRVMIGAAERYQVEVAIPGDEFWPEEQLARLGEHRPLVLYVRGDASLLVDAKKIAIVGARAATGYGEHMAMETTSGLVDKGVTIVSGAAYGIDGMAHRAALAGKGRTIAVLAGGVDRFYPSGHDALLLRVVESGAVVSELPIGAQPTKWRFLQRNRLIAALSDAVVVVEAGWRSGSLNTAGHASALGIPLGAVPGPVTSMASAGCHRMIRDFDATLVTNTREMYELGNYPYERTILSATEES